tara:strand:- start:32 stop:373 length:342 start_codon:yes stop_codon:yes gene_type:complete
MTADSTTPAPLEFPYAPLGWTPKDGECIAESEGLDLTSDHWTVIQALQEYFARNEGYIKVRELQDALHEKFHHIGGRKRLFQLLPGGPVAQGCRLAGLKSPSGSVDLSFGSVY